MARPSKTEPAKTVSKSQNITTKQHGTGVRGKPREVQFNTKPTSLPEAPEPSSSTRSRRGGRLIGRAVEDSLAPAARTSPKRSMEQTASVIEANHKAPRRRVTQPISSDHRELIIQGAPNRARTDPNQTIAPTSKRILTTEEQPEVSVGKRWKVYKSPSRSTPPTQSRLDNEEELDLEEVLQFIRDAQEQRRNKFGVSGTVNNAVYETRNGSPPRPEDMQVD